MGANFVGIRERLGSILDNAPKTKHTGTDDGDHERFSHYADKAKIVESAVTGKAIRALCGKKWIPSRDPEKYPVCPVCKEIYDGLPRKSPDK